MVGYEETGGALPKCDGRNVIFSNCYGWIAYRQKYDRRFYELLIGRRGEQGRRVALFDAEEKSSEENAREFAKHLFNMLKNDEQIFVGEQK